MVVVGGIYSHNHYSSRCCPWAHQTVCGASDRVLFTVRCLPRQHTVGVCSDWPLKSFVFLLHRTVRCVLTSQLWLLTSTLCSFTVHCSRLLTHLTVALLAHRTCPVYTVQSGELYRSASLRNPRVASSRGAWPGHQTLSGAPLAILMLVFALKLGWVPNLISFLVYVELYAPEINDN
jgi:hypothetical protein